MLSEEAKNFIGKDTDIKTFEVEKGAIRRFADAVDDPNPLYWDEDYARKSRYGAIIAPPGFFGWPGKQVRGSALNIDIPAELLTALEQAGYLQANALDAGIEYEFHLPVRAGDILSVTTTVNNIRERSGMVFIILTTSYRHQNRDLAATAQATVILRSNQT